MIGRPLTFGPYPVSEWAPIFDQFSWAKDMPADKIFSEVGQYDLVLAGKSYCRVCGGYEHRTNLKAHAKVHKREFAQWHARNRKVADAEQRDRLHLINKERKLTGRTTMSEAKITAKQQGVPDEYLNEKGNFRVGQDARCKSDLVSSALGIKDPKMLHTFTPDEAEKLLKIRDWTHYLDRKREIIAGQAKTKTEKKAKVKAEVADKKAPTQAEVPAKKARAPYGSLSRVKKEQPTGNADQLREQREAQFERDQAAKAETV